MKVVGDSPLYQLTLARLKLLFREPGAMFWTFGFPMVLAIALGIAFRNQPPEPVRAAVQDGSGAAAMLSALAKSARVKPELLSAASARQALRDGAVAIVVAPGDPVTYVFDPTRPDSRLARLVVNDVLQRALGRKDVTRARDEMVTEPGARYIDFLIPGLLGLILMSSGLWGIGYTIVETRTKNLLKRMLATPMRRGDFLLSFVLMRVVFLFAEVPVLVGFGHFVFGVPVRGSLALLLLVSLLGALSFGGIGLLLASRAQNIQTVSGLMNLVMMPMYVGSGVFFSISKFPKAVQPYLKALPLTALNDALRAIMNEGAGLAGVLPQLAILTGITVVSFAVAVKLFRWS